MRRRHRPRPKPEQGPRVNHRIRAKQVRVVDADGNQLGIMTSQDAIRRAEEQGLDLVEVAATAFPPVCRIMDYGKFKYEQKKKAAEAKRNATTTQLKEVKMRPKTDSHDFDFKVRHAKRFLNQGDKVKVTIMFRGREITHQEVARRLLDRVVGELKELAAVESAAKMEGRNMFLVLAPLKAKAAPGPKPAKEKGPGDGLAAVPDTPSASLRPPEPTVEVRRKPTIQKRERAKTPAPAAEKPKDLPPEPVEATPPAVEPAKEAEAAAPPVVAEAAPAPAPEKKVTKKKVAKKATAAAKKTTATKKTTTKKAATKKKVTKKKAAKKATKKKATKKKKKA